MKKIAVKIVGFFVKDHMAKYVVVTTGFVALFGLLLYLAAVDVVSNVFGTIVGFILSSMLFYAVKIVSGRLEDMLKINYDTEALLNLYEARPDYRKKVVRGGTEKEFAYAETYVGDGRDLSLEDDPDKRFEPDDFVVENYAHIFSAHSASVKKNFDTVRVDRFDAKSRTLYLSRSCYFHHLVTNRAVDFALFDDVSLRTLFEYGPALRSFEESKMSNHIGINALVFLNDGRLLVPQRDAGATIAKNKITSSIAVMLNFPADCTDPRHCRISKEYLLRGNLIKNLFDRVKIPQGAAEIAEESVETHFLGFGQSVYEGGKPQFYYSVTLKNVDTAKYFALREAYLEEQKKDRKKARIDVDKCMYAADFESFRYVKDRIRFDAYNAKGKRKRVKSGYEMSYLCNLWHYEEAKKKNPS